MDERRLILQMLQEGKLTVDEAERLLAALGEDQSTQAQAEAVCEGGGPHRAEWGAGGWEDLVAELRHLEDEMRRVKEQLHGAHAEVCAQAGHFRSIAHEEVRRAREKARAEVDRARRRVISRVRGENFGWWE